jgi:hypothetical protein
MNTRKNLMIVLAFLLAIVVAGCTAQNPQSSDAPAALPTTLPTPLPSQTPAPAGLEAKSEWNLVVIGDSSLWGLADALAVQIEKEVGVKVNVFDFALSTLSAGEVLQVLETGKASRFQLQKLPDALRQADFVVIYACPKDSEDPEHPNEIDGCFADQAPGTCGLEVYDVYIDHLQGIWEKIFELKAGEPVILRAVDVYNPLLARWEASGVQDACTACWEHLSDAVHAAANNANVPFVSRLDIYNGANHDEDPIEKGYISDGQHPSELGAQVQAEWITKLGYEATRP